MSNSKTRIVAKVARILSPAELIITAGATDGVRAGYVVEILDPNATDIRDPDTNELLGSLRRVVARGSVSNVEDRISLVRRTGRSGIGSLGALIAGSVDPEELREGPWPERVRVGDPVETWRPRDFTPPADDLAVGTIVDVDRLGRCRLVDVHPDRNPRQYTVETVEIPHRRAVVGASSIRAVE